MDAFASPLAPSLPAPTAAPTTAVVHHAPIDIAQLRRPRRRIRSTIVMTTVVGMFAGLLAVGAVLAWRTIDEQPGTPATQTTWPTPIR
jgi:hypothetical protein